MAGDLPRAVGVLRLAFWGAWLLLILAPTSTILPIADAAVEHRMYLPLAATAVLFVVGVYELARVAVARAGVAEEITIWICAAVLALAAAGLGFATVARNEAYRSELAMWGDIVAKRPANARAQFSYGVSLTKQGRLRESIVPLTEAVRLRPNASDARTELGASLYREGRKEEGLAQLVEAVRLEPGAWYAQNNLATALIMEGRVDDAITHYLAAIRANPGAAEAHYNLALALVRQGDTGQAIARLQDALRIRPNYPDARNNLRALQAHAEQAKAAR